MASKKAHHASGLAAGLIAAALVSRSDASGPFHVMTLAAIAAGWLGGTAPDWLEIAWWRRKHKLWITHRTLTHWGLAWLALLYYSYTQLGLYLWAAPLFGFAAGGVMHLLADWPNPMGVPWIYRRHSLNLWKSGRCDSIIVLSAWVLAFCLCDKFLFAGVHLQKIAQVMASA